MNFEADSFNCRNAYLPLILTQASIEVDNYLIYKKVDFEKTKKVQELFKKSLSKKLATDQIFVISEGLEVFYNRQLAKTQEIYSGLESIVNDISNIESLEILRLEKLRDFL